MCFHKISIRHAMICACPTPWQLSFPNHPHHLLSITSPLFRFNYTFYCFFLVTSLLPQSNYCFSHLLVTKATWQKQTSLKAVKKSNCRVLRKESWPVCQNRFLCGQSDIPPGLPPLWSSARTLGHPPPHRWPWPLPKCQSDQRKWRWLVQCHLVPGHRKGAECQTPGETGTENYLSVSDKR